jgi:hypothetical protein
MQEKTVLRVEKNKDNPFVMIDNRVFLDENLSWKAKGILGYLLSRPDDWKIIVGDLIKHSTDGKTSVYSGLDELLKYGYIERRERRSKEGQFMPTEYVIHEKPNRVLRSGYGKPVCGERDTTNTEYTNTDHTKTEKQTNNYSESAVAESRTADYKSFPTEEYIPLGQYLESQGGTNYFDLDSIEATKYYINSYRRVFNKDHPRYTKEKWSDIIDSVLLMPKVDRDSGEVYISEDPYDYFEIIERIIAYFRQKFRENCNYAILHFLEPEVKWRIEQKVRCGEEN